MVRKNVLKARLILYSKGRILLLKQRKQAGGNYSLVGGTIESTEFAAASLIRESLEEAGIVLKRKDLELAHVLHKKTLSGDRITLYFKAQRWEGKPRALEPEKFKKAEWFDLEKLPTNLTPTVGHVLKMYRAGKLYSEFEEK
ncbi:MAG: NUDIX domain-containing protein [Saprospiraceae bacterium]|nr:NUDIX domain-containing protein [Saprospiraceae bacterium]